MGAGTCEEVDKIRGRSARSRIVPGRTQTRAWPRRTRRQPVERFALFDLLRLSFIPRQRDASDLRLHGLGEPTGLPVDVVLRSRARPARIVEQYDDLRRTAASLKRGS